ncbi:uncharacterized protein LOC125261132 [Megalobrama amblycephala]|uniref:uncharacterized protein LOC125261132 n=1 Tax=Megalobrama amblycephala TaxID=75352 RepID=UPI0020142E83|nr:uncharacterized protein LOC125261132 [Megalobrama amblycephala]
MKLIFGLMLLKTAACLEFNCRFNQSDPCYAALGHKLNLLMVDTSRYDLKILKIINYNSDDPDCRVKNDRIKENECDLFNNRPEVSFINGILIINRVIRADSGTYRLEVFGSDGRKTTKYLQVIVEAPIGSVEVSIIYSSCGLMRVFCSSDGDPRLFSWTLNGDPLMDGNIIDLDEGTDGNISCSVKNHVSHRQKTVRLRDLQRVPQGHKCSEFHCSFNQPKPCYATLGDKLKLLLVLDPSRYDLKILKRMNNTQDDPVCRVKTDKMKKRECDLFNNRPEVSFTNGILIINSVIRADSGNYRLEVFGSDGTITPGDLQVIVEESSVSVVFVLVWCFQMMFLLGLLGGFHIYMRHTSGKKQEDQQVRMSRFREGHEHTAED